MSTPDAESGYRAMAGRPFCNELAARVAIAIIFYRPVLYASRVSCPMLVQISERDSVAPAVAAEELVRRAAGRAEAVHYEMGHFDVHHGAHFERAVADQLAFLRQHLPAPGKSSPSRGVVL